MFRLTMPFPFNFAMNWRTHRIAGVRLLLVYQFTLLRLGPAQEGQHWLVKGCDTNGIVHADEGLPRRERDSVSAGVVICCALNGSSAVRFEDNDGCASTSNVTFGEAESWCAFRDMRLCSNQDEIDLSCDGGCMHNDALAWISQSGITQWRQFGREGYQCEPFHNFMYHAVADESQCQDDTEARGHVFYAYAEPANETDHGPLGELGPACWPACCLTTPTCQRLPADSWPWRIFTSHRNVAAPTWAPNDDGLFQVFAGGVQLDGPEYCYADGADWTHWGTCCCIPGCCFDNCRTGIQWWCLPDENIFLADETVAENAIRNYSHYRLTLLASFEAAPTASAVQFSEVLLFAGARPVDRSVATTMRLSGHACAAGISPHLHMAVDGDRTTMLCVEDGGVFDIIFPHAVAVDGVSFITGADAQDRDPRLFKLEGSHGDSIWYMVVDHTCSDVPRILGRESATGILTTESSCGLMELDADASPSQHDAAERSLALEALASVDDVQQITRVLPGGGAMTAFRISSEASSGGGVSTFEGKVSLEVSVAVPAASLSGLGVAVVVFTEHSGGEESYPSQSVGSPLASGAVGVSFVTEEGQLLEGPLPEPVNLTLPVNRSIGVSCAYWDDAIGNWSHVGVRVVGRLNNAVVCETTHLSVFAAVLSAAVDAAITELTEFLACSNADVFSLKALKRLSSSDGFARPTTGFLMALLLLFITVLMLAEKHDAHTRKKLGWDKKQLVTSDEEFDFDKKSFMKLVRGPRSLGRFITTLSAEHVAAHEHGVVNANELKWAHALQMTAAGPASPADKSQGTGTTIQETISRRMNRMMVRDVPVLFQALHPWLSLRSFSVSLPASSRTMLVIAKCLGALTTSALFFERTAKSSAPFDEMGEDCEPEGVWHSLFRSILTGVVASLLSAVPTAALAALRKRPLLFKKDGNDKVLARQILIFRIKACVFLSIIVVYICLCVLFLLCFASGVNSTVELSWLVSALTIMLKQMFVGPLQMALIYTAIASAYLATQRGDPSSSKEFSGDREESADEQPTAVQTEEPEIEEEDLAAAPAQDAAREDTRDATSECEVGAASDRDVPAAPPGRRWCMFGGCCDPAPKAAADLKFAPAAFDALTPVAEDLEEVKNKHGWSCKGGLGGSCF